MNSYFYKFIQNGKARIAVSFAASLALNAWFFFLVDDWLDSKVGELGAHLISAATLAIFATGVIWLIAKSLDTIHWQSEKIKVLDERQKTHQATMAATCHYLNNTLNQFQLVTLKFDTTGTIDKATLEEIRSAMQKTAKDITELTELEDPSPLNVEQFIKQRL
jgi:hypothetical protein